MGALEEGVHGRETQTKALMVVAAQEDGRRIGRVRMQRMADASAKSLMAFVQESIESGSLVHTDGWSGYDPLQSHGYRHRITLSRGQPELLPGVHRVVSLLKRWLLGTHQGAVTLEHLDYYLDEFTFRFNRCRSRSRGKLFRQVQQAMAVEPITYKSINSSGKAVHP